jgi:hypothetical protein
MASLALYLAHALVIGPALLYIGFAPDTVPDSIYTALMFLGIFILGYHAYRAYTKVVAGGVGSAWVNWIHIFLVAPLLITVGYTKKDAPRRFFEMMMLLGFAATGYHAMYVVRDLMLR